LFIVVGKDAGRFIAWKAHIENGMISHPAFSERLPINSESIERCTIEGRAPNGAEPTAHFTHDSLYRQVTLTDLFVNSTQL
jgi:hypothetical protein